ncbi:uncharacterized protein PHA67_023415 [Liasis olivaceus]
MKSRDHVKNLRVSILIHSEPLPFSSVYPEAMYGNTLRKEEGVPRKTWHSLPPEPAKQGALSTEEYDNCSEENNYDSISLSCEQKAPAKPLDPDIKPVTAPSIFSPAQWKKYWKRNRIDVLLILTGISLLLGVLLLSKLRSLNFSSTKEGCGASTAPFNFTELKTNFLTKLRNLEQRFDEKRTASLQNVEEQLFRIERKLDGLQNERDTRWRRFQTNSYYFSHPAEKWEMARKKCADVDSHLLIINSKKEQDFVIQNVEYSIWLGLNDAEEEGTWRWVDGSPLEKGFWRQGEPSDSGTTGEDCAVLYKEGNWNDIHCDTKASFVCEKEQVCVH